MLIKYSIVFCVILVVSLASSEESVKIEVDAQDKHFEQKSVSKRGVHSFGTFGHPHGGLHYTDYTLPPAIPFYGKHFAHKPLLVQHQPFQIAHGGADVTSYSSSFPQYPYQQKPFHHIPILSKPAFVPSVYPSSFNPLYASSISNISPTFGFAPQRPIIPIAVPVSGQPN